MIRRRRPMLAVLVRCVARSSRRSRGRSLLARRAWELVERPRAAGWSARRLRRGRRRSAISGRSDRSTPPACSGRSAAAAAACIWRRRSARWRAHRVRRRRRRCRRAADRWLALAAVPTGDHARASSGSASRPCRISSRALAALPLGAAIAFVLVAPRPAIRERSGKLTRHVSPSTPPSETATRRAARRDRGGPMRRHARCVLAWLVPGAGTFDWSGQTRKGGDLLRRADRRCSRSAWRSAASCSPFAASASRSCFSAALAQWALGAAAPARGAARASARATSPPRPTSTATRSSSSPGC